MFTESIGELLLATLAFVGGHFAISSTPLRPSLVARLGEGAYLGLFSLTMVIALIWMAMSYRNAPQIVLWPQFSWTRHLPLVVMPAALILVVAALRPDNPTMVGAQTRSLQADTLGLFAITRHPFLWGTTLWAVAHIPPNGDAASLILMGGILLLALGGTIAIDVKLRRHQPDAWQALAGVTSNIPFAALVSGRATWNWASIGWFPLLGSGVAYGLLLISHQWLFGVSPLP